MKICMCNPGTTSSIVMEYRRLKWQFVVNCAKTTLQFAAPKYCWSALRAN